MRSTRNSSGVAEISPEHRFDEIISILSTGPVRLIEAGPPPSPPDSNGNGRVVTSPFRVEPDDRLPMPGTLLTRELLKSQRPGYSLPVIAKSGRLVLHFTLILYNGIAGGR